MTTHDDTTGFTPENPYEAEARQRWGHTDAYKQSQERVSKMSKEDMDRIKHDADVITKELAAAAEAGNDPSDPMAQEVIAKHFQWLRHFYEPSLQMYRGLGDMYVDDPRFTATYDKYRPGLAVFMRDAMHAYCDAQEKTTRKAA